MQVLVVGAGPIGLTLALRLAQRGVAVTLLEAQAQPERIGSRAICMQRETLEIWDRGGVGERVAQRGVRWRTGRTYLGTRELFSVELPGAGNERFPPFVNISQSEVEGLLADRCSAVGVDLRPGLRLTGLTQDADGLDAHFETDAGASTSLRSDWLVGADGAHSAVRHALGLEFRGYGFDDRFLICDIRARLPFPNERRFFFDPPWNPGRQVLIHPQPDDVWRIDWQVPADTDVEAERASGRLDERIRSIVGPDLPYELVWATTYRFSQRIVDRFRVGRVLLAGDAAHLMSPFGARGLNSGVADAENMAWKLAAVIDGNAPERLLDSYDIERRAAALENLAVTESTMRFMVPHGPLRRAWRNLALRLSPRSAWFRRRVNSGRLAQPFAYVGSPIIAPGPDDPNLPRHGSLAPDVPLVGTDAGGRRIRRLRELTGRSFGLLVMGESASVLRSPTGPACEVWTVPPLGDPSGRLRATYAPNGPRAWLIRPDAYLASSVALDPDAPVDLGAMLAAAVGR